METVSSVTFASGWAGCPTSRGFRDVGFLRHRKL